MAITMIAITAAHPIGVNPFFPFMLAPPSWLVLLPNHAMAKPDQKTRISNTKVIAAFVPNEMPLARYNRTNAKSVREPNMISGAPMTNSPFKNSMLLTSLLLVLLHDFGDTWTVSPDSSRRSDLTIAGSLTLKMAPLSAIILIIFSFPLFLIGPRTFTNPLTSSGSLTNLPGDKKWPHSEHFFRFFLTLNHSSHVMQ
jgi:hypothetical protein